MYKVHDVKNPTMNRVLRSKFAVRTQADGTIIKNRLIEEDASNDIIQGTLDSVRAFAANQAAGRLNGDFFDAEIGPVYLTAGTDLVAGQRFKCGTGGKAIAFIDSSLINTEIDSFDGAVFTNQPADDTVTVVSTSALDVTQKITIYGIDTASGAFKSEQLTLTGTSDVDTTVTTDWAVVVAAELDSVCVGDIEVSENSGGLEIVTISAGDLTAGIETIANGYAYNKKATLVADGASTGKCVLIHKATDGASDTQVIVTTNGAAEVELGVASYIISKAYTGNIAAVNLDLDVTGTEDDLKLAVGRVIKGADAGDEIIGNI